jgi:hypothetical protein
MTIPLFVGADDLWGRRRFCVFDIEEPIRSKGFSSRTDAVVIVADDRHGSEDSNLQRQVRRERAVQEPWGLPCLSRSRRSVRIRF